MGLFSSLRRAPSDATEAGAPELAEPGELQAARDTIASVLRALAEHALPTVAVAREGFAETCERLALEVLLQDRLDGDARGRRKRDKVYADVRATVRQQRAAESREYSAHRESAHIILTDLVESLRAALAEREEQQEEVLGLVTRLEASVGSGDLEGIRAATARAGTRIRAILVEQRERSQSQLEHLSGQLRSMRQELDQARSQMQRDPLTSLFNRGAFDDGIRRTVALCEASGTDLTLYMADIDHFKRVNDAHGHQAGDSVLEAVARQLLRSFPRKDDLVARYGGEEFGALCRNVGAEHAAMLGERARAAVGRLRLDVPGGAVEPTVSIGYAVLRPGEGAADLVRRADAALYAAKRAGRDRVEGAE